MEFYRDCLGGEILDLSVYGDSPEPVAPENKDKIIHVHLKAEGIELMASDVLPDRPFTEGNNFSLILDVNSEEELDRLFSKLSEGGNVSMKPQDTFWNAKFCMFKDKFGISWMINCSRK